MVRQTIDQTASEVQLHRVLYVIKFLRAMVLHLLLALFAPCCSSWWGSMECIQLPTIQTARTGAAPTYVCDMRTISIK